MCYRGMDGQTVEQRLSKVLQDSGATGFIFKAVPSDYYGRTYEERRDLLGAASVHHLCKSIVMVRTRSLHMFPKAYFLKDFATSGMAQPQVQ